jgi:hypothetical protein
MTTTRHGYEVCKKQRGGNGEWFTYPASRFDTETEAVAYADAFAAEQQGVAGTRIVVRRRKGDQVIRDIRCG